MSYFQAQCITIDPGLAVGTRFRYRCFWPGGDTGWSKYHGVIGNDYTIHLDLYHRAGILKLNDIVRTEVHTEAGVSNSDSQDVQYTQNGVNALYSLHGTVDSFTIGDPSKSRFPCGEN